MQKALTSLGASLHPSMASAAPPAVPAVPADGASAFWHLDQAAARLVAPNCSVVPLTSRELQLLGHLAAANADLVSKQALLEAMNYMNLENGFHRIESQLARLRRKTLQATGMALPVSAVFGKGLVFVP